MRLDLCSMTALSFVLTLASLAGGCDFAQGVQDVGSALGNTDSALIDAPGRQLAEGKFQSITVDGSLDDGGKIVALQDTDDLKRVAVIPYPEGDICYIDPAFAFDRVSSRMSVELPGLFSVQRDIEENGRGEVGLFDFNCKQLYPSIEDARLPRVLFPSEEPKGMLSIDGAETLNLIIPGEANLLEIEQGVSLARTSQHYIFALKNDSIVVKNAELETIDELGHGLVDFIPHQGPRISLALMDEQGLSVWSEADGLVQLSASACSPTFWGNDVLAYFDPCEDRTLRVYLVKSRIPLEGDDFVILDGPSGVASLVERSTAWGPSVPSTRFSFLLGAKNASEGTLAVASVPPDAEVIDGHLALHVIEFDGTKTTFLGSEILTDFDGKSGTLVELDQGDTPEDLELLSLAQHVAQVFGGTPRSPHGILANFDGTVGDLVILKDSDGEKPTGTTLLHQVPSQTISLEGETGRWVVVADAPDGTSGTLYLSKSDMSPVEAIAENVLTHSARFLDQPRGVAFLSGSATDDSAALKVYLIESGLTVDVHSTVNEYRPLPWPSPGVLYSVPEGKDQGLWYAKAR